MGNIMSSLWHHSNKGQQLQCVDDHMKPLKYSFTPTSRIHHVPPRKIFSFLNTGRDSNPDIHGHDDICIKPEESLVPWPSSFPAARQCKYWEMAQKSCEELIYEKRSLGKSESKLLPKGFSSSDSTQGLTPQESAFVETAVSAAIYMVPNSPPVRIKIIAQLYMLLWTHDDILEHSFSDAGETVVDMIITQHLRALSKNDGSASGNSIVPSLALSPELLDDPHELLREVLRHFCAFIDYTRVQKRDKFQDIRDFLNHRAIDVGADFVAACVRFGNRLDLSAQELADVQHLVDLANDHITLVNDLCSFDKEKQAHKEEGDLFLNAVHYVEDVLETNSLLAKHVTMSLIQDYEGKIEAEIERLEQCRTLNAAQWNYSMCTPWSKQLPEIFCFLSLLVVMGQRLLSYAMLS